MLRRALLFFHNVYVKKSKAILVACCLNNLYGCCASLQTCLNFLIMKKNTKKKSSTISKTSTKKAKRNSLRFWIRPGQTSSWWDNFCAGQKVSEEWKENLRMSQESFEKLCTGLRPCIQKNKNRFRDPISVEKQVSATLYYFADEGRMRKVANSFGIGKSTVSKIIGSVTDAVSNYLGSKYIVLRTNEKDIEEMTSNFYNSHGFPQCIGAVDGTHVGVKRPSLNANDFINRKRKYTLNIQAAADYNDCFFDVVIK